MRQQWENILRHKSKTHTKVRHDFKFLKLLLLLRDLRIHTHMDSNIHFPFIDKPAAIIDKPAAIDDRFTCNTSNFEL